VNFTGESQFARSIKIRASETIVRRTPGRFATMAKWF